LSSEFGLSTPSVQHNNGDLLLWALYTVGGAERWVDVEEIYLAAFRLAPARLAWRTRPDLPNYKICARGLQDLENAKEPRYGGLLEKRGPHHRKLTLHVVRSALGSAFESLQRSNCAERGAPGRCSTNALRHTIGRIWRLECDERLVDTGLGTR